LGVILPRTGAEDLTIYADYVREGIELAVERFRGEGGRWVELAVRDDSGGVAGAARATLDLESTGVHAIVGPLLGDAFAAIASSRTDTVLPILSPTASDLPSRSANAYSLNAIDRRGAEALAEWAVRRGSTALAMLYPRDPAYAALASAFRAEAERIGARIVADIAYAPATTTFQADINTLRAARPAAVFVPAPERQIRQLAPQLRYYGLTNVTVLGNEAWVSAEVLRTVAAGTLEGVVVATPMPPDSSLTGWADFVREYEARFRRTLDNPYPALGYDAASLALEGIRRAGGRREEVAVALRGIRDFRGATGLLSIENGRITRRPFLVRIRAGKPELISSGGGP
jgi:branched-chain amino acid transport system substrate-binding protein